MTVVYLDLATNPTGLTMVSVLWLLLTLSTVFVGLRIYSKLNRNRSLWWDDYVIICSWFFLLISCSCTTHNTRLGFGRPGAQIPFENVVRFGITSNLSGSMSVAAVAWSKTSFGLTLLRLVNDRRALRALLIGMLVVVNVTHHCSVMFFWFSCDPVEKSWDPRVEGTCWSPSKFVIYSICVGACSAVCDFVLALLPWVLLLRFNMYNGEKIGVAIAMSMGIFTGIACIVKITTFSVFFSDDFSRDSLGLILWGFIEPSVTIMAASIPFMRHLFKSLSRSMGGQTHDLESEGSNSSSSTNSTNSTGTSTNTTASHTNHQSPSAADLDNIYRAPNIHTRMPAPRPPLSISSGESDRFEIEGWRGRIARFIPELWKKWRNRPSGQDITSDGRGNAANRGTEEAGKEDGKAEMRKHWGQLYGGLQGPSGEK